MSIGISQKAQILGGLGLIEVKIEMQANLGERGLISDIDQKRG